MWADENGSRLTSHRGPLLSQAGGFNMKKNTACKKGCVTRKKLRGRVLRIFNQLKHKLLEKNRMGQSRHKAKQAAREAYLKKHGSLKGYNPQKVDGIYSLQTMNTYISCMVGFAFFCAQQGANKCRSITKEMAEDYLWYLCDNGYSMWTIKKVGSAINKALDFGLMPSKMGIPDRRKEDIKHNRTDNGKAHLIKELDQVSMVLGTGIRRMSILTICPADAVRDSKGICVGLHATEKGGKHRVAPVLNDFRAKISKIVDEAEAENGKDAPIFQRYDRNIQYHRLRAQHIGSLLRQLHAEREAGEPLFGGSFAPEEYIRLKGKDKDRKPQTRGWDTDLLAAVSGAVGHNRVAVILTSYDYFL